MRTKNNRGVAAVEFALTLPIWVTFILGTSDGVYCMLVNERTDRIAYTVTDIVTQYQTITLANLNDISLAAGQLMEPINFSNNGVIIVTSIYKPAGSEPVIEWQYRGGGSISQNSRVGSKGGTPTLPNGLTLNDNDNVIVSEVFYNFSPLFISDTVFPTTTLYRTAVYKPRLSPLINAPS